MKIVFLGPQGSGKSTQAKMLSQAINVPYIEMGEILRIKARTGDDLAIEIKKSLDQGILVPDNITTATLKEEIAKSEYTNGYILDGYPRNEAQLDSLEKMDRVFYIKISDEEAVKRLMLRKREDDTKELLAKRLQVYHGQTEPLLKNFEEQGILIEINGEQSIENVQRDILKNIENNEL